MFKHFNEYNVFSSSGIRYTLFVTQWGSINKSRVENHKFIFLNDPPILVTVIGGNDFAIISRVIIFISSVLQLLQINLRISEI